jgi:hypothetical protein
MGTPRGMYRLEPSTPSLLRQEPLLNGTVAPARTLFVLGEEGGYGAAPEPVNRLVLGRNSDHVHVTIGAGDWYVSREHAMLYCIGRDSSAEWMLRNDGKLPIRIPDAPDLLHGQETVLPFGYTPLFVRGTHQHVVEVLISSGRTGEAAPRPDTRTRDLGVPLTDRERLVLVAVYQDYLSRVDKPHPWSWRQASVALNAVSAKKEWTERMAESVVDALRHRLEKLGWTGITTVTAHPEDIKANLIRLLLETATLVPPDLRLLDNGTEDEGE